MNKLGYDLKLSTGSIAAGGTLGFLIPPSIGFVVYGTLTEQSVGRLLVAGILPGFLLMVAYGVTVLAIVRIRPELAPQPEVRISRLSRWRSLAAVWEPIAVFCVAVGGIYLGVFTPTEGGAVGATLLFVIAVAKRRLRMAYVIKALDDTLSVSVMVFMLVAGAGVFGRFLALSTIPSHVAQWITDLPTARVATLAVFVLLYLVLGCFLDAVSMMVLTMPIVFPVISELGYDPIWFGVIMVLMMEAGLITPPVGLNIYTVQGVALATLGKRVPAEVIFKGVAPFLLAILAVTTLVTLFPQLALILPSLMRR